MILFFTSFLWRAAFNLSLIVYFEIFFKLNYGKLIIKQKINLLWIAEQQPQQKVWKQSDKAEPLIKINFIIKNLYLKILLLLFIIN